mmetsp:Transcript_13735/g.20988  ORF Transcript_13735/g.20988 Transcript_13735/m.20988 type:complete len:94 (+) Transcript_13735:91-372(+)
MIAAREFPTSGQHDGPNTAKINAKPAVDRGICKEQERDQKIRISMPIKFRVLILRDSSTIEAMADSNARKTSRAGTVEFVSTMRVPNRKEETN